MFKHNNKTWISRFTEKTTSTEHTHVKASESGLITWSDHTKQLYVETERTDEDRSDKWRGIASELSTLVGLTPSFMDVQPNLVSSYNLSYI